ncbi:MAG: hypothetical protein HXY21_06815 [Parvularculaceae bacterium]|nr:hypothetical protein [Parvularculaceae bacterium]
MRALFILLALSCPAAAETGEPGPRFDLREERAGGVTTIAVLNRATGAFAVASGQADLDLLAGDAAMEALRTILGGDALDRAPSDRSRGIVVHKMDYDEDKSDPLSENEVRLVRRHARDDLDEGELPGGGGFAPDGGHLLAEDGESARRDIRILGTDRREALKFIDAAEGLDADEKAAMKAAIGVAE